jgi:hypothetical protein
MKKVFFSLAFMLIGLFASANTNGEFPKYSSVLYLEEACSCSGMFSSCSGSGSCSCSCGYFSCTCTANEDKLKNAIAVNISISEDQYGNIIKLADELTKLKMDKAVTYLKESIEFLKDKDAINFEVKRKDFFNELSNMSNKKKNKLNKFFANIGAEERV